MVVFDTGHLTNDLHKAMDKVPALALLGLLVLFSFLLRPALEFIVLRPVSWLLSQPARKKIWKAADTIEKGAGSVLKEMQPYQTALQAFIAQYNADKTQVAPALDALKKAITRVALPKMDPTKFQNVTEFCYIHVYGELYYRAFYNGVMLAKSCDLYREFFAQNNWHHLEDIEALVVSFYHSTPLKAHAEYVTKNVPDKDADYALRYFTAYAHLLDNVLDHARALQTDLARIKKANTFVWWLAGGT